MKIYKVKVNGKVYEVELEAVSEAPGSISAPAANTAAAAPVTGGANSILAPIAGKVVDVKVNVGDMVKKGQTVAVIEAMKLENEIQSQFDGKVVEIKASKGAQVNNKDVLIVLG
ncbi:MAG: DUF2118 domain-containing protein [Erysipelotrichaceae bacterium]|nr:DUF2118 domain-containing protein [Erysipelotrichaceae bacterium]